MPGEKIQARKSDRTARKAAASGPIKLDDVAIAAGVSRKTASRVINGELYVSKSKREAVQSAVVALGYRPNLQARALASSRSFMIGMFSAYLGGYYFSELHRSAIRASKAKGRHVLLEEVDLKDPSLRHYIEQILLQMRFEGVLLTPLIADDPNILDTLERLNIRYVRMSPTRDFDRSDAVFTDQNQGMDLLAEHLVALGHERIGIVGGPSGLVSQVRRDTLTKALIRRGIDPDNLTFSNLNWHSRPEEAARQVAADLLTADRIPTAIFGLNDEVAAGLMRQAFERGLNVPDDLSVVGFDDADIARAIWPPLTTVRQSLREMAKRAVSLLLEPADGTSRQVTIPVSLVVRGSTAPPRKAR